MWKIMYWLNNALKNNDKKVKFLFPFLLVWGFRACESLKKLASGR